jgi:hypothetical protein
MGRSRKFKYGPLIWVRNNGGLGWKEGQVRTAQILGIFGR